MWLHVVRKSFFALIVVSLLCTGIWLVALQVGGGRLLSVQSGSMQPQLAKGDLVAVTRIPTSQLAIGDVVTFANPANNKQTITHRIIAKQSDTTSSRIITKGDANEVADNPIAPSMVIGKLQYHIPYAGFALDFIKQPIGLLLFIYIPAFAVVLSEIKQLSKQYGHRNVLYVLPGYVRIKSSSIWKLPQFIIAGTVVPVLMLGFAMQAYAVLNASATLQSSSITIIWSNNASSSVLFRSVNLRCSKDNTISENRRPAISIYNPGSKKIITNGWKIIDNDGTVVNIPNGMTMRAHHKYIFTPYLSSGLSYDGDRLVLVNGTGDSIDAISWGTDVSQLNPAIQSVAAGSKLLRTPPKNDTNTTSSWIVTGHQCNKHSDHGYWYHNEIGDDDNDCGDLSETDRVAKTGTFNWREYADN